MAGPHRAPGWILCTAFLLAFAGCVRGAAADGTTGGALKDIVVTERDSGAAITLERGQAIAVKLAGIPGTGYAWHLVHCNADVLSPAGESTEGRTDPRIIGGPVTKVFRFKALAPGRTPLEFHYKRIWETDKPPLRTFTIGIEVR
ncbi:MAG: protease inhibitor I42 family protein [Syntrophaceae bacterium]|nr:protease inhibitor I42 family protein [Syntrophaceae bacterium]